MTRPQRHDKGTKRGSVISGLRLEPKLATALRDAARDRAGGNVAEMARHLIHTQLGWSIEDAHNLEERHQKPARLCGLALPAIAYRSLASRASDEGLTVTGTARHLLRLGLGVSKDESLRREETFTSLANALREVREAHR